MNLVDTAMSKELRVLSWNLQLLWPQAGTPPQLRARSVRVAAKLLALQPQPDCLCLQEVWCPDCRAFLRSALKEVYPHALSPEDAYVMCASPLRLASAKCGLLMLSSLEMTGTAFSRFTALGLENAIFDKGVTGGFLHCPVGLDGPPSDTFVSEDISLTPLPRCAPPPSRAWIVITTHLQSDFWGEALGKRARTKQLLELRAFVGHLAAKAAHSNIAVIGCVICGDLNVAAGSQEAASLRALRATDLLDALPDDASFPLGVWRRVGYERRQPTCRLDYILDASPLCRSDGARLLVKSLQMVTGIAEDALGLLSDHACATAVLAVPI